MLRNRSGEGPLEKYNGAWNAPFGRRRSGPRVVMRYPLAIVWVVNAKSRDSGGLWRTRVARARKPTSSPKKRPRFFVAAFSLQPLFPHNFSRSENASTAPNRACFGKFSLYTLLPFPRRFLMITQTAIKLESLTSFGMKTLFSRQSDAAS